MNYNSFIIISVDIGWNYLFIDNKLVKENLLDVKKKFIIKYVDENF